MTQTTPWRRMSKANLIRRSLVLVAIAVAFAARGQEGSSKETFSSPSAKYNIRMLQRPVEGSAGWNKGATLAIFLGEQLLSKFPTDGYIGDVFWSPGEQYVAVNNRLANQGDYVWVFSLADGKALKAPGEIPGEVFADRATRKFPEASLENFVKYWNVAKGWKSGNELETRTRLIFRGLSGAAIDRAAIYRIVGDRLVQEQETFEKVKIE
jgi:hypothetical protein